VQSLLIIGFVWPEPNSAAGGRMIQLVAVSKQGLKSAPLLHKTSTFSTDLESKVENNPS
jgi:hypothetical protein